MTHPEELLAGYVDGSLSGQDRTTVDAHLQVTPALHGGARVRIVIVIVGAAHDDDAVALSPEQQGLRARQPGVLAGLNIALFAFSVTTDTTVGGVASEV